MTARDAGDVAEMARIARRVRALPESHGIGETLLARNADALHRDAEAREWLRRADALATDDTRLEVDMAWLDVLAFGGDVDGVRRRIDSIPDARIELAGGAPALSGFLGVALARAGRFAEALPPLLDALAGGATNIETSMFNLTNYGFALRACRAAPDARCPALRTEAHAYLRHMQATGRRSAGFLTEAGLLHAAATMAAVDARTLTDDVRLAPVRADPRIAAFLGELPATLDTAASSDTARSAKGRG